MVCGTIGSKDFTSHTHTSTHLGSGVEEGEEGQRLATWQLADKF